MKSMHDDDTTGLVKLRNDLGPDVVIGLIDIGDDAVVRECRPGSSSDTDFADQNRRQFRAVFGVACGRLEQTTLCAGLFSKRDALERFWAENPKTRAGLVTWWPGVMIVWLRVAGVVPRNVGFGK